MSRCGKCKYYEPLHKPRNIQGDAYVYGLCFKDYHGDFGTPYLVYIPDSGTCKKFVKGKESHDDYEYEMTQEFRCECCKKELLGKISKLLN